MNYRIGLDIGITSVGWAVIENDFQDEPKKLIKAGVRIFDAAEVPKTGASLAQPRREARGTRRLLRRKKHRLHRIKGLFERENLITKEELDEMYNSKHLPNVYELRFEALYRELSNKELAQILLHIAKHRGFKSTRKAETKEKDGGLVLTALENNKKLMLEKGYKTVGEMLYCDEQFRIEIPWIEKGYTIATRNKAGNYNNTMPRSLLVEEVETIFEKQKEYGNPYVTDTLRDKYIEMLTSQRSFDEGPGGSNFNELIDKMVGKCTFEKTEKRGSKASFTATRFVLLQKVNSLKIATNGEQRFLYEEEKNLLKTYAFDKKVTTYTDIRKLLKLTDETRFIGLSYGTEKISKVEKANFYEMKTFYDIRKAMPNINWKNISEEEIQLVDEVARILSIYKSDDKRISALEKIGVEVTDDLLLINPTKFQNLSIKAMKKINVYLEQGCLYNEACKKAGYQFTDLSSDTKKMFLDSSIVNDLMLVLPNPVVKRAISQTVKVLNAIIREYGSPQAVSIEMAREMAKNYTERQKINKNNELNQKKNNAIKVEIKELFNREATGLDIVKYKLWKEQDGVCMYSGKTIPLESLFEPGAAEIDHAIPYSRCFDDSMKNKVLVTVKENRDKGNRTPYEYMGANEERWNLYKALVNQRIKDYRKREHLLRTVITKEELKGFKERNLTDTKYIAVAVSRLIRNNLLFADFNNSEKKKHVLTVNGFVTDYLKKRWGFAKKDRRTDRHHALDAVIIACATDKMTNNISRNIQARELEYSKNLTWFDEKTGETFDRNNFTREQWNEKFGVKIPTPWMYFKDEIEMRLSENPEYFRSDLIKLGYDPNENIEPLFVSMMPKHKVTGQGHAETIRSAKKFSESGIVITKTNLENLKLDKNGEIERYYKKETDRLLYEALKHQLELYNGDGKKAFTENFYKTNSDGTRGPLVRKVKIYEKCTLGVFVNNNKGITFNGEMVRIDIFREDGKYYMIPIYASDTVKKELPNKAASSKSYAQWKEMKEENFLFSLYKKDLIKIKHKTGINVTTYDGTKEKRNDIMVYLKSADISGGSIKVRAHDNSFTARGIGIQSLEYIKKYQVDVLGNVTEVKKEKREKFKK